MGNFRIKKQGKSAIVEFHGEQLMEDVLEQKEKIAEIINSAEGVRIVMGEDVRLHPAQLQLILSLMNDFRKRGKKIETVGLENKQVKKQLEIAGCYSFFNYANGKL
ncbi:hypothetical protein B6D60_10150 [candidate division KSB1 bacterium 4484_87]|nr:MAG: hypothetical protein B6D60_10150 [candidate division KSB1 bacterium 4484_87]